VSTYVIAEAGCCHDGDLAKALGLAQAAADVGASAVKYQFWSDPDALADRRRVPSRYREIYRRYRVPAEWLRRLAAEASARRIDFMCTTYLPGDIATVAPFVRTFKVASFEAADAEFIRAHGAYLKDRTRDIIISLGMGAQRPSITIVCGWRCAYLLCVSAYPAPVGALNLARLHCGDDDDEAASYDGFSDHSDPALTWTGALAVAAGARIVEAHLRLDGTDLLNPDAPHAMLPRQFADYVRHIRFAERCLGSSDAGMQPCETEMAQYRVRS